MILIDRESPIPAYYQVENDLKTRIAQGEWKIDQQLPTEAELAAAYSVSRVTLRQALAELEKDGLIKKFRGKGAFVCEKPRQFIHDLRYSLVSSELKKDDDVVALHARMLHLELLKNTYEPVNQALGLALGEPVIYFKRLFLLDDKPIAIGKSWIPADLVPDLETLGLIDNSLSKTISQRYHLNPVKVDDVLETVRPTLSETQLLGVSNDATLILIKGISTLDDGRPLEFSNTLWLGDRVRFHFTLEKFDGKFVMRS